MRGLEEDRPGLRWGSSLGVVLAAHALIIAAILCWPSPRPTPPPRAAEAVMVELAPLPSAPPAKPTQLPPGPAQQEQRKAPPKLNPEPAPKPEPAPPQEKAETVLPQPTQQQHNQEHADNDVAQTSSPPSVHAPAGSHYAAEQSLAGAAAHAMVTWQSQLLGHLEKFKRYPRPAQRLHYEGIVMVRYTVDRHGDVQSVRLAESSGREPLDAEAVAAVQRASPLPPPPPEIPGDPVEVTTPIEFSLRK